MEDSDILNFITEVQSKISANSNLDKDFLQLISERKIVLASCSTSVGYYAYLYTTIVDYLFNDSHVLSLNRDLANLLLMAEELIHMDKEPLILEHIYGSPYFDVRIRARKIETIILRTQEFTIPELIDLYFIFLFDPKGLSASLSVKEVVNKTLVAHLRILGGFVYLFSGDWILAGINFHLADPVSNEDFIESVISKQFDSLKEKKMVLEAECLRNLRHKLDWYLLTNKFLEQLALLKGIRTTKAYSGIIDATMTTYNSSDVSIHIKQHINIEGNSLPLYQHLKSNSKVVYDYLQKETRGIRRLSPWAFFFASNIDAEFLKAYEKNLCKIMDIIDTLINDDAEENAKAEDYHQRRLNYDGLDEFFGHGRENIWNID